MHFIKILQESNEAVIAMNGREAVEHFAKCHHLGKPEFMYFNIAPNRHYRPYDVIEVQKEKVWNSSTLKL